ncbi:MAG: DUF2336 domain-containing protein [Acetobacteraceae bacterium]|nr:DUF2336 domain-containing protein [Acetobacteraceae bacterium]
MSGTKRVVNETVAGDSAARVRRAASGRVAADELRELAADQEVLVRVAVAINRSCTPGVDQVLATDADERVRALLAGRIARMIPDLAAEHVESAAEHVRRTLAVLVEDEAVRVRAAIADAVKEMPQAPRELVLRLAHDPVVQVSDPILRLSPVLTDADLLALLAAPPHPCAAASIAARPCVSAAVTDAIAAHASAPAIRAMLANGSACIREATLDGLVGRAPAHEEWHGPLVRRPALSASAQDALATFVGAQWLEVLARRTDLEPSVIETVRTRLQARGRLHMQEERTDRALIAELLRLKKAGELDEKVLLAAARAGQKRRVAAALAVACDVPLARIERVVSLRSAKALVSLAWHAGFSMQAAVAVQTAAGQFGPTQVLAPTQEGKFPLSEEEMRWQLELLDDSLDRMGPECGRPGTVAAQPISVS